MATVADVEIYITPQRPGRPWHAFGYWARPYEQRLQLRAPRHVLRSPRLRRRIHESTRRQARAIE
jgi:hypothetical protein